MDPEGKIKMLHSNHIKQPRVEMDEVEYKGLRWKWKGRMGKKENDKNNEGW